MKIYAFVNEFIFASKQEKEKNNAVTSKLIILDNPQDHQLCLMSLPRQV